MGKAKEWADEYIKQLSSMSDRDRLASATQAGDPLSIASKLISTSKPSSFTGNDLVDPDFSSSPGLGSRILDIISRPLYTVQNSVKYGIDNPDSTSILDFVPGGTSIIDNANKQNRANRGLTQDQRHIDPASNQNAFTAIGRGFTGKDKTTTADSRRALMGDKAYEETREENPVGNFFVNLIGDIATDPTSLIGPGAIRAIGKGGKAAANFVRGGTKEAAKKADDVVDDAISTAPPTLAAKDASVANAAGAVAKSGLDKNAGLVSKLVQVESTSSKIQNVAKDIAVRGSRVTPVVKAEAEAVRTADPVLSNIKPIEKPPTAPREYNNADQAEDWVQMRRILSRPDNANSGRGVREVLNDQNKIALSRGFAPAIRSSDDAADSYPLFLSDIDEIVPLNGVAPKAALAGAARAMDIMATGQAATVRGGAIYRQQLNDIVEHMAKAAGRVPKAGAATVSKSYQKYARALLAKRDSLFTRSTENAAAVIQKNADDTGRLIAQESRVVEDSLNSAVTTTAQAANVLSDIGANVEKAGKELGATDAATEATAQTVAKRAVQLGLGPTDVSASRTALRAANDRSRHGWGNPAVNSRLTDRFGAQYRANSQEGLRQADDLGIDVTKDIGLKTDFTLRENLIRAFNPVSQRLTTGTEHAVTAKSLHREGVNAVSWITQNYNRGLGKLTKAHTPDDVKAAWSSIMRNEAPTGERVIAARGELGKYVDAVFETKGNALMSVMLRNGASFDNVNRVMKETGLGAFQFSEKAADDAITALKKAGKPVPSRAEVIANQFRTWKIDDPVDFLSKFQAASANLITRQTVARSLVDNFAGGAGANIRLVDSGPNSMIGQFIPASARFNKETADLIHILEQTLQKPTSFRGAKGPTAAFVNNFLDPVMNAWKPWVTIARPGHHSRNMMGEIITNAMDGVVSLRHYKTAAAIQKAGGKYKDNPMLAQGALFGDEVAEGAGHAFTVKLAGGKVAPVSIDRAHQLSRQFGVTSSYRVYEDVANETGKGALSTVSKKLTENRYMTTMGAFSEYYSSGARLAHMSALMSKPAFTRKFKTVEEAVSAASQRVKRFHPDPHGLNPAEAKYARRVIPFYSWLRQTIPVMLETTLVHPGRVLAIPKATYNALESAGVDPNSLTDQFPPEKLYPSFVRDNLTGPFGKGTLVDFGSSVEAVYGAGLLNGPVGRNVLGMVNPILKAPVELSSGQSLGTGAKILDKSEYADAMLPVVGQVANISGYSPTGTVANTLTSSPAGMLDPQRAVQRGEKEAFLNTSTLNFLLGLGIQNINKPSYQKFAKAELNPGR